MLAENLATESVETHKLDRYPRRSSLPFLREDGIGEQHGYTDFSGGSNVISDVMAIDIYSKKL